MGTVKKTLALFIVIIFSFIALCPMPRADAARITRFYINDANTFLNAGSYLFAGKEYIPFVESDKASTTSTEYFKLEYSTDNGATWINLPVYNTPELFFNFFMLPIDPIFISAHFRVSAYFSPLIGSRSYSEKTIGPYKILQPADPSELTATPNDDGTVTLKWNDNSNMESFYQITRYGPDGTKTFNVNDTIDNIGPITYLDKQTNKDKSTVYVYSISAVIDKYELPDGLQPGNVNAIAKTRVPLKPSDALRIDPDTPIANFEGEFNYLKKYITNAADLYKVAVTSVKLDKTAITLKTGGSEALTATVIPSGAVNRKVTWSSDNPQIAKVDNTGNVKAQSPGAAKITVQTEDGKFTAVCVVTVTGFSEIELVQPNPGRDKLIYDPGIIPIAVTDVSELDMISIQQKLSERQAAIQILKNMQESVHNSAKDVINNMGPGHIAVGNVYISDEALTLRAGESKELTATVAPSDASNRDVSWSSDNPQVAEVDQSGKVTGKSPGSAKITVKTAEGGFTNICDVTVVVNLRDIAGHQANKEIVLAMAQGIVNGYPDETFRPDGNITRAEFTVMLMNGLKPQTEPAELTFTDKSGIADWAAQPVAQAAELGIISGYPDGTFRADANITHAEMISMVIRASGLTTGNEQPQQSGFIDAADIPDWAKKAATTAEETGIIIVGGLPGNKFAPQELSTRAEAASAIVRMLLIKK